MLAAVTFSVSFHGLLLLSSCACLLVQVVFGGELQEKGCQFELRVDTAEDLNRLTLARMNVA